MENADYRNDLLNTLQKGKRMALVNIKEMLEKARREHYAVGAFDASTIESAIAIVEAAEEERSPVIIMGLTPDLEQGNGKMLTYWIESLKDLAQKASVPVCLHLDHAKDMNFLKKCVDAGFTSVMYDASEYPFEENIRLSKEAADYAHAHGATVEAELGHVGDGIVSGIIKEDGVYDNPEDYLTNPEEMKKFIEKTNVDCLAVAVGTSHGVYVHEPKLDFERLELLNTISTVPMVIHGGSGTPDDQIKKAISLGVTKLNIYSEMMAAYFGTMKEELEKAGTMAIWMSNANREPLKALKQVVKEKMHLVGSAGKA